MIEVELGDGAVPSRPIVKFDVLSQSEAVKRATRRDIFRLPGGGEHWNNFAILAISDQSLVHPSLSEELIGEVLVRVDGSDRIKKAAPSTGSNCDVGRATDNLYRV